MQTEKFPALKLENVSIELGGELILDKISMEIHHGETIVIVGPSGGGKTVLLKTLAGIYSPQIGHAFCEGEDWQNLQSEAKRKLAAKIGVQFQKSALFDDLNVGENISFPLKEHHPELSDDEAEKRVDFCLDAVNLTAAKKLMSFELSGGMKQRLAIARAIAMNPEIIFYDDPTAGLDPINSDRMKELIINLKEQYKSTIIVVTHDLDLAWQMAGRVFLVANQQVIEMGNKKSAESNTNPLVQQYIHGRLSGPLKWG